MEFMLNLKVIVKYLLLLSAFFVISIIIYYASKTIYTAYLVPQGEVPTIYADDDSDTKILPTHKGGINIPNADSTVYDKLKQTIDNEEPKITFATGPEPVLKPHNTDVNEDHLDEILQKILNAKDVQEKDVELNETLMPKKIISSNDRSKHISKEKEDDSAHAFGFNIVKITNDEQKFSKLTSGAQKNRYYKIQLASTKTEEMGLKALEKIKNKNYKILKNASLSLRKVEDQNGEFFYLILAGDFSSIGLAKKACKELIYQNQNCIINKE